MVTVKIIGLLIAVLVSCAGASAQQLDLRDFGAVGDDTADDSPALQAALNALASLESSSAKLHVPKGVYRLATGVALDFNSLKSDVFIEGEGSASVFHIASGPGTTTLSLGGAQSLTMRDLVFVGTTGVATDADVALSLNGNFKTNLENLTFYGLSSSANEGAVLSVSFTDLAARGLSFRGCAGSYSPPSSVMTVADWKGFNIQDTQFIDYGTLQGVYYSKTATITHHWMIVGNPHQSHEGVGRIERMYCDEGAAHCIIASATSNDAQINISEVNYNINPTDLGGGIYLSGFKYARVSNSKFTTLNSLPSPRNFLSFVGVEYAIVDGVRGYAKANIVSADKGTGNLEIRNSNFETLTSAAAQTHVENSTITSATATGDASRRGNGTQVFGSLALPTGHANEFRGSVKVSGMEAPVIIHGVANWGNGGNGTPRTYWVVAIDNFGRRSQLSPPFTIQNGWSNINVDAGRHHYLVWTAVPGATSYHLLRDQTVRLVATTTAPNFQDRSETYSAYSPPVQSESSELSVEGDVKASRFVLNQTVTWTSGTLAPTGTCQNGSLYSRVGTVTDLYFCKNSIWVLK